MGKTRKKAPSESQPYWKLVAFSAVATVVETTLHRAVTASVAPTIWILISIAIEVGFAVAVYAVRPSIATAVTVQVIFGALLRTINAVKIYYLSMPLLPSDFFLTKELFHILPLSMLTAFAFGIGAPVLCAIWLVARRFEWPPWRRGLLTVPFALFVFVLMMFPNNYSDFFDGLFKNQIFGIPFLLLERQSAVGFPLSFSIDVAQFRAIARNPPDEEKVLNAMSRMHRPALASGEGFKPRNVYMILVESFWDPSWLVNVPNVLDPDFREIWKASGGRHLLSPMFGGGTANVEFELLCGIPSGAISHGIIFQVALSNELPCLPKVLSRAGYATFAFHAFDAGYYNRRTAFPIIGFDSFMGVDAFVPSPARGVFVPDEDFLEKSIQEAQIRSSGRPFLAYLMTFAGHWPYAWIPEKYKKEIELPQTSDKSRAVLETLERHLNVNRISSEALAKTVRKLQKEDPTAIVVVAGDHLPSVGIIDLDPDTLDPDASDWRFYRTPLLFIDAKKNEPIGADVPAFQIPGQILDRLGMAEEAQAHMAYFQPPSGLTIRPVQQELAFVSGPTTNKNFVTCNFSKTDPTCKTANDWLIDAQVLAHDLVVGSQYMLSHP